MKKNSSEIIKEAQNWLKEEIQKTGSPPLNLHEICEEAAKNLSKKYGADETTVMLGTELMDIKLGDSMKKKEPEKHIQKSEAAAREFLEAHGLAAKEQEEILACIREHHNLGNFSSKESEICANADCYKFLTLKGFILFVAALQQREMNYEDAIKYAAKKYNEKKNILTLEYAKNELKQQMKIIEEIISQNDNSEQADA